MAKKLTPRQVLRELNDIIETFSGKSISGWVEEGWDKFRETKVGEAGAPLERAARAMDPYAVFGLPKDASLEDFERRYRQLAQIYHPDKQGGYGEAMKLVNNAYEEIKKKKKGG